MPSRAEMRIRVEQVLRGILLVVLAVMLWHSLTAAPGSSASSVNARGIRRGDLAKWGALAKAPERIQLQIDAVPSAVERAWLGALAGAGSNTTWSGEVSPLMVDALPIVAPTGGTKVLISGPPGSSIVLSDEIGVIDTLRPESVAAAVTLGASDRLSARANGSTAAATKRDSVVLRRLMVIGNAGWESKFVVAALEEEGWKVDALIRVAPTVDVTQGPTTSIDTARYSAVIALDAAAAPYANRIAEYVRNGGAVVLEPSAAALDAFSALRAGAVTRASSSNDAAQSSAPVNLANLPLNQIIPLRDDAIPLEKRGAAVTSAARRVGAGRVLQLGFDDTWRWRMAGGDGALRDYRQWWTRQVSSVAYAPRIPRTRIVSAGQTAADKRDISDDPAPLSDLVANIGPATSMGSISRKRESSDYITWLFVVLVAVLVGEVASRRLRGAA